MAAGTILVGVCINVVDGDTLQVQSAGRTDTLRLARVSAPELNSPGGGSAKRILASLVLSKSVQYRVDARDVYGRAVSEVWVGGANVNDKMIAAGYGE